MSKFRAFFPAAVYYLFIFFLSSRSRVRFPLVFPGIDKILHFILYAGFGACLAWSFARLNSGGRRKQIVFILALGTVAAGLDEIHQMFVPGRTADWGDLAFDVLGILAGWAMGRALLRVREARRRRKQLPGSASQP